MMQKTTTVTQ